MSNESERLMHLVGWFIWMKDRECLPQPLKYIGITVFIRLVHPNT